MAYQRILQLTYVEDLLAALKSLFIKLFEPFLATFVASLHAVNSGKLSSELTASWNFSKAFEGWDKVFDKLLRGLEDKAAQASFSLLTVQSLTCHLRKGNLACDPLSFQLLRIQVLPRTIPVQVLLTA